MADTPAPVFSCLRCGYDLDSIRATICPECGQTHTEADRSARPRQLMFLELTRMDLALRGALVLLGAALLVPRGTPREWDWLLAAYLAASLSFVVSVASAGVGLVAARRLPTLHRRLFRRAWLLASFWVSLPLLGFGAVWVVASRVAVWWWRGWFGWWPWLVAGVLLAGFAAAPFAWKRSWSRLLHASGLPAGPEEGGPAHLGRVVMFSVMRLVGYAVLVLGSVAASLYVIDTYWPNGWRSR